MGDKVSLTVNYAEKTWERARKAYVAKLSDPGSPPTLLGWVLSAVAEHADRSPRERASTAGEQGTTGTGRIARVHQVDPQVLARIDECRAADRQWDAVSRVRSRSGWVNEAVELAAAEVERSHGGKLPDVGKLPTGPAARRLS